MKMLKGSRWLVLAMVTLGVTGILTGVWYLSSGGSEPEDDGVFVIGYCADNLVIERWQRDQEIFVAKAAKEGIEVIVHNANENNETQVAQIQSLIDKKVDVIVVIPYDKEGLSEVILAAKEAGIKVIAYDRLINNAPIDAYVSFDNLKVGQLQAEEALKLTPTGNYVLLNGSPDDNNSSMFHEGVMTGLSEAINKNQVRIVGEIWAENWREEPAYKAIADLLDRGVEIDAIIGANDRLAEAAILALAEAGLAGEVTVAGHDADISACQRIVEGTQAITVYKPIRELAGKALEVAIALNENKAVEVTETIQNGFMAVPYVKLDVLPVTIDTLDATVIADGFHLAVEVYRK